MGMGINQDGNGNDSYSYEIPKVGKDVAMISFWKANRAMLPQLFKVACRILCLPASGSSAPAAACSKTANQPLP